MRFHSCESVGTHSGFSDATIVSQTRLKGNYPFENVFSGKHFALAITGKVGEGKYLSFSQPCSSILWWVGYFFSVFASLAASFSPSILHKH